MKIHEQPQIPEVRKDRVKTIERKGGNFTIHYRHEEGKRSDYKRMDFVTDVVLDIPGENGQSTSISFTKYLPSGWRFNTGPTFSADPEYK